MRNIQLTFVCFFLLGISFAQEPIKQQNTEKFPNTIKGQFEKIYKKSGNYQIYKVIKKEDFLKLQKYVLDSISLIEKQTIAKQQTINSQQKNITSLEKNISKLNEDLSSSKGKENSISLFGLQLNKTSYNTLLWGIITILLVSLLFFIFKFKNSNSLTKEAKKALLDVEQDFELYRKKTIEKEQKLRRQLQDEINKQRGV